MVGVVTCKGVEALIDAGFKGFLGWFLGKVSLKNETKGQYYLPLSFQKNKNRGFVSLEAKAEMSASALIR
jgi:hypothetical protein